MPKEITSVYVPVKTPDHKVMAVLAAVLVHIGVLGFIIYTNHTKPLNEPPMQMSLVTPEQLAMIQGQAAAHQQAQAAANAAASNPTASPTNPAVASVNNDLAARQAKWQRDQAAYAAQLDKQAMQEKQQFDNQIKQVQMSQAAELNKLKVIQDNPETPQPLSPTTPKPATTQPRVTSTATGAGKETGQTSQNTSAGDGSNTTSNDTGMSRADYKTQVATIIHGKWQTAPGDKGKQLKAHFDISATGEISNIVVDGADSPLKNALYQAIQAANPLPPPPSKHAAAFAHNTSLFIAQ